MLGTITPFGAESTLTGNAETLTSLITSLANSSTIKLDESWTTRSSGVIENDAATDPGKRRPFL